MIIIYMQWHFVDFGGLVFIFGSGVFLVVVCLIFFLFLYLEYRDIAQSRRLYNVMIKLKNPKDLILFDAIRISM